MSEILNEVLNPDGTMKLCGREKCKELLTAIDNLGIPGLDIKKFGDPQTGMLNLAEIKRIKDLISQSIRAGGNNVDSGTGGSETKASLENKDGLYRLWGSIKEEKPEDKERINKIWGNIKEKIKS